MNFRFTPPAELPASGAAKNGRYFWTLDVNISVPGADFIRQYEIPVFAPAAEAADSSEGTQDADTPDRHTASGTTASAGAFSVAPQGSEELLDRILKLGYSSRGRLFSFLPFRSLKLSLNLIAMGVLFSGTGCFLYIKSDAPLPFLLVFILCGVAMFLFGILSLVQRRDITISSDRVRITSSYFGLKRTTGLAVADITGFSKRIGYHTGGGAGYRAAYSIYLNTRGGKTFKVGDSLPGSGIADYVISEMQKILQLPATGAQETQSADPETGKAGLQRLQRTRLLVKGSVVIMFLLVAWNFLAKFLIHWR